jgi:hypothetical protein
MRTLGRAACGLGAHQALVRPDVPSALSFSFKASLKAALCVIMAWCPASGIGAQPSQKSVRENPITIRSFI